MKIVFTGGGTGGHFYPVIAVAQKVNQIIDSEHILGAKLYYISDSPYDKKMLVENELMFEQVSTGKMRTYFSVKNFSDIFKTFFGVINAIFKLFSIYPDVIFGKGGYASFPVMFAARILHIPVIIHESDSAPGRVNKWAGRFAKKIAISFPEAAEYFSKEKTIATNFITAMINTNTKCNERQISELIQDCALARMMDCGNSQDSCLNAKTTIQYLLENTIKKWRSDFK